MFSQPGKVDGPKVEEGWRDSLYRAYKSSQQSMRVAVYGTKHDAATFERLLRDICVFEPVTQSRASAMIDTAVLGCPKVCKAPKVADVLCAAGCST